MNRYFLIYLFGLNLIFAQNYEVDKGRITNLFENLKTFGVNDNQGNDRVAYSNFDIQAREFIKDKLEKIGVIVKTDFAGNLVGIYNPQNSVLKPISFGSHIDAVPNGGHYDGQVGVIASIEVLQSIYDQKIT